MFINRASFIATAAEDKDGVVAGTVEVTIRNETRRIAARSIAARGWIITNEITGRYQTGGKAWPGHILSSEDGTEKVHFGRYDNNPKFRKENAISFN
jgi:hypothetical protein